MVLEQAFRDAAEEFEKVADAIESGEVSPRGLVWIVDGEDGGSLNFAVEEGVETGIVARWSLAQLLNAIEQESEDDLESILVKTVQELERIRTSSVDVVDDKSQDR